MSTQPFVAWCRHCGKTYQLTIPEEALAKWRNGEHLQVAWPQGTAAERELLISRTCGDCWDAIFGNDD